MNGLRSLCEKVSGDLDKARVAFGFAGTKPASPSEQMLNIKQAFAALRDVINSPAVKDLQKQYTAAKGAGQKVLNASDVVLEQETVDVMGLFARS